VPRLYTEDATTCLHVAAALRAVALAVPECLSELCEAVFGQLVETQGDAAKVGRPVLGLCFVVRAATALNRGGAIDASSLFGMAKALASRQLDADPDLVFTSAGCVGGGGGATLTASPAAGT
jgi:hypothetical protein